MRHSLMAQPFPLNIRRVHTLACLAVGWLLLPWVAQAAHANSTSHAPVRVVAAAPEVAPATDAARVAKRRPKKAQRAGTEATLPSGEGVRARERRLHRECKGQPNAGACRGYAS